MQSKQITKGKWKVVVSVCESISKGMYVHGLNTYYEEELVSEFTIICTRKKLDPYMWFEAYEAVCYHKPYLHTPEWQNIIRELAKQK